MSYPVLYPKNERTQTAAIAGKAVAGQTIVGSTTVQSLPFSTHGLGTLSDAISCTVTEKRNDSYELKMQYPVTGLHFGDIGLRKIILAKPNFNDGAQPFRIYRITKPLNGICTIYAQHISYDLSGYQIPAGKTAASVSAACSKLSEWSGGFTITTNKSSAGTWKTYEPTSVRSWLGGKEGSLLDIYGGEWHWDMYTCTLKSARGQNRGVAIRYGKNLTSLKQDEDCANLYTGVIAYYKDDAGHVVQGSQASTGLSIGDTRILFIDASGEYTDTPSASQLTSYAASYIAANNLSTPKINLELDFVQMQGLTDRVDLCDTVTVIYEELGVQASAKCIETTWDVLKERYTSTKFGDPIVNIADTIAGLLGK